MKRVVEGQFTFTCGKHDVPLQGHPEFLTLYGADGMENPIIDRGSKPNGKYAADLSEMHCPVGERAMLVASGAGRDDASLDCSDHWRVWLDG